jgi:hypothetical protein
VTADLIQLSGLVGERCVQRGQAEQMDDSHVEQNRVGQHEISSCCSEQHTIGNLRTVYFWNFPFNTLTSWLTADN